MFKMLIIVLAAGLAAGFLMRGSLRTLSTLELRFVPLALAGLVVGLLPLFADLTRTVDQALLAVANLLVAGFLVVNFRVQAGLVRAGMAVLALGWLLNAAAIVPNAGMPLSERAYRASGQTDPITEREGGFFKIVLADEDTKLRHLGDVIPIAPLRQVVSIGDIVLGLGIGLVVVGGMTQRREAATGDRVAKSVEG